MPERQTAEPRTPHCGPSAQNAGARDRQSCGQQGDHQTVGGTMANESVF